MPPVWYIFCWLTGVPGIINILRTRSYLPNNQVIGSLIANTLSASFIFLILKFANAEELQSNFDINVHIQCIFIHNIWRRCLVVT